MLKVFTIKFENNLESFNDSALSNFISDKEITRWEYVFVACPLALLAFLVRPGEIKKIKNIAPKY
jgi:hypothetical protein